MQVELHRLRKQCAAPGLRFQSSKTLYSITQDDVLGFDVPRRQRTSTTRPRYISSFELLFLSTSKVSTQTSSPVPEATDDEADEEALVAAALFDLANAGAGPRGGAGAAGSNAAPPLHKRNGVLYLGMSNGRTAPAPSGPSWHVGALPTKRRRSHDLLAGEDDYVDGDDGDGGTAMYENLHSSPSGPPAHEAAPYHNAGPAGARRGRGAAGVPAGTSGRGSIVNGRYYLNDGRNIAIRSGRGPRADPAHADEEDDAKPLLPALAGRAAGGGPHRAAPNCVLYGQTTITAARAASKLSMALERPAGTRQSVEQHEAAAGSRPGSGPGIANTREPRAERAGVEEASEHIEESLGRRRGSGDGQLDGSPELAAETGAKRPQPGMSYAAGELACKAEAGTGGSGPVSPGADAGGGADAGAPARERTDPSVVLPPHGGPLGPPSAGGSAGRHKPYPLPFPGKSTVPLIGVPPHISLQEFLASATAARLVPAPGLTSWQPPSHLAGLLQGSSPASSWSVAAEIMSKRFSDAAVKAVSQHPLTAPPHSHLHAIQQLQQQQQAVLNAAATGTPLAAGMPAGGLELLQAISGHSQSLPAAAVAAAPTTMGLACGLPPGGPTAPGAGISAVTGLAACPAAQGTGANGDGTGAIVTGLRFMPFKRCAQHVYIAHLIAQQQQHQHQRKAARTEQRQGSASCGNGATSSGRTHSDPNRPGSGSPVRKAGSTGPARETSTGGGEASGGTGGVAHSPEGTSHGNGGGGGGTSSGNRLQQPRIASLPGAESVSTGAATSAPAPTTGNGGGRGGAQPPGTKASDSDAQTAGASSGRGVPLGSSQQQQQQQQQQQHPAATAAALAAAAVPMTLPPGVPPGPGPLLPPPGFQLPSHAAAAAAIMAAVANGGLTGVPSAQQSQALAAVAAAVASGAGGPLLLPRGGPGPSPAPPPPHAAGPLGVVPTLPSPLAQLLIGGPPVAGAHGGAGASYALPPFVPGLTPAGGASAFPAGGPAAPCGPPGFATSGAAAAAAAALSAAVAASALPPAAGPLAAAASQLAPFFGGALPPHFAAAPGAGLAPPPAGVVLPPHLAQSAAVHPLAAAWQQQQ